MVEHAIGYRAEFGYPADLYVSPNMSTEDRNNLESRYQVPVSAWDPSMVDQIVAAEEEYKNKKLNAANEVIKMQYPMQHYTGPVVFHFGGGLGQAPTNPPSIILSPDEVSLILDPNDQAARGLLPAEIKKSMDAADKELGKIDTIAIKSFADLTFKNYLDYLKIV